VKTKKPTATTLEQEQTAADIEKNIQTATSAQLQEWCTIRGFSVSLLSILMFGFSDSFCPYAV
jgi:hypothetical protein